MWCACAQVQGRKDVVQREPACRAVHHCPLTHMPGTPLGLTHDEGGSDRFRWRADRRRVGRRAVLRGRDTGRPLLVAKMVVVTCSRPVSSSALF